MSDDHTPATPGDPIADDRSVLHANPERLKGLGHPLRVAILDQLMTNGPATASILGERLGESSGATSYHLRQLERHGFIEEDTERGQGKERWWRRRPGQIDISPTELQEDPAALEAAALIVGQFGAVRARYLEDFLRRGLPQLGLPWVEASSVTNAIVAMTVDELHEFSEAITEVLRQTAEGLRDRERPPGARTIVVQFNAFPLVDDPRADETERKTP